MIMTRPGQSDAILRQMHPNARFNAKDPVFDKILSQAEGPEGLVVLGSLMFPQDATAAVYEPEPLLPEDVFVHFDSISLRVRFRMRIGTRRAQSFRAGSLKRSAITDQYGTQQSGLDKVKAGIGAKLNSQLSNTHSGRVESGFMRRLRMKREASAKLKEPEKENVGVIKNTFLAAAAYARGEAADICESASSRQWRERSEGGERGEKGRGGSVRRDDASTCANGEKKSSPNT